MTTNKTNKKTNVSAFGTKKITKKEVNNFYKKLNSISYSYPLGQKVHSTKKTSVISFSQTANAGV